MTKFGNVQPSLDNSEHVGPDTTGDNVHAKKVVSYSWNSNTNEWERDSGSNPNYAVRLDDTTTADTTYIGKAATASATSAAVWQIAKLDTSSGLIKTWADGDSQFDNIWDSRSSLNYS